MIIGNIEDIIPFFCNITSYVNFLLKPKKLLISGIIHEEEYRPILNILDDMVPTIQSPKKDEKISEKVKIEDNVDYVSRWLNERTEQSDSNMHTSDLYDDYKLFDITLSHLDFVRILRQYRIVKRGVWANGCGKQGVQYIALKTKL